MSAISCQQRQFGILETGQPVTCYSLRNTSGMTVNLLNYGAILNAVQIPDLRGDMHEMTLGGSELLDLKNATLSGATVIHLPERYGITFESLSRRLWEAENITQDKAASVKLSYQGHLDLKYSASQLEYRCSIEYTLTTSDELIIRSEIQTTPLLPVFITQQPVWNLTGEPTGTVNDHVLQVWASQYSQTDTAGFVKPEFSEIGDQPAFDFQQPQRVGEKYAQIPKTSPYDVCFKLADAENSFSNNPSSILLAARVKAPVSGRILEVYTNQPGLRFSLKEAPQNMLKGFDLHPVSLLNAKGATPSNTASIQQETHYKLIW